MCTVQLHKEMMRYVKYHCYVKYYSLGIKFAIKIRTECNLCSGVLLEKFEGSNLLISGCRL